MNQKNIIIILIAIIVVLSAMIALVVFHPFDAKQPSMIKITSNKTIYEGDDLSVQLTDLNKTAISNEIVNITIYDKDGKAVVDDVVKTNSKGKAKLDLDLKKGKYTVNVTYGGNDNFTGNNTTQKLTVKEEVKETESVSQSSSPTSSDTYVEREEDGFKYGYKDGRYGFWTPSGNFIEDKSRALSGEDPMEPFMEDGSFNDQL